ncbi:MAG: GntR family transcriptional regulator [Polaromonas sp.]
MHLTKTTLEKQAYAALREQIMAGHLPAGGRLLPKELAADMDISQTPVKGALALLERDGLVEGCDRRYAVVRRFSPTDVMNIYAARQLVELEAAALGLASGRCNAEFLAAMESLLVEQGAQADLGTQEGLAEVVRLDREFHELIVSLSDNPVLKDWHRALMWQTHTLRIYSLHDYGFGRARTEHCDIIDAFRGGDTAVVTRVLRHHLEESRADMLLRISQTKPAKPGSPSA